MIWTTHYVWEVVDGEHGGKLILQGSVRKGQERVIKWMVAAPECS